MSRLMGEPLQYLIVDHDAALATGYDCISRGHLCGELGTYHLPNRTLCIGRRPRNHRLCETLGMICIIQITILLRHGA